jgi:hypothetical protein
MGRAIKPLILAYFIVGIVTTVVTEVIAALQGSSVVLGAFSNGSSVDVLLTAVAKYWVVPVVTWPISIFGFALRELSARG